MAEPAKSLAEKAAAATQRASGWMLLAPGEAVRAASRLDRRSSSSSTRGAPGP